MTTEELENKLKISEDICIHCSTFELTQKVLDIFNKLNLEWGIDYRKYINTWNIHKENTVYYPFNGCFSSLKFAQLTGYNVIDADNFIVLHTEGKEFVLENYIPKGELEDFPKEIIARMLECQEEQGNKRDVSFFEINKYATLEQEGFNWNKTIEQDIFWGEVIINENYNLFFARYPKKEKDSQEFKVRDKVYDILLKEVGVVQSIDYSPNIRYRLLVEFKSGLKSYAINGCYLLNSKNPQLFHYIEDYNYDVIDFNNLPERQEAKRWRAREGEAYYSFTADFKVEKHIEDNDYFDNKTYDLDNYFKTKEEAQEVADKLNKYFQELINPNK